MVKGDDFEDRERREGGFSALSDSVYAIQRASGASVFGWELIMDATHMAGGFFPFGNGKGAYCIINLASSLA